MIEGLRLLPWLQELMRRDFRQVDYLTDCDACRGLTENKQVTPTPLLTRRVNGCPYETPMPGVRQEPWQHPGYTGEAPTTCAGYTTKLPEVVEINKARLHWKHGQLRDFCGGRPNDLVMRGIEILEGAANEASSWRPPEDK